MQQDARECETIGSETGPPRDGAPGQRWFHAWEQAVRSKRISIGQIRSDTELQVAQLTQAGEDCLVRAWQRQADGSVQYTPVTTTFLSVPQDYEATYPDLKRRRYFTAVEWATLKKLGPEVRFYCQGRRNLWCGVVSAGPPCLASEVGDRGTQIIESLRRFFENSSHPIELILSVLHQDEVSQRDALGRALIHVHAHFIFRCKVPGPKLPALDRSFRNRFPVGGYIKSIEHVGKEISYILRTPNLRPLLISGDYVDWSRSVSGHRRIACYGGLRKARAIWKRNRQRIAASPYFDQQSLRWCERYHLEQKPPTHQRAFRNGIRVIEPNTRVGETLINAPRGQFKATIIKNAQRRTVDSSQLCPQYSTSNSLVLVQDGSPMTKLQGSSEPRIVSSNSSRTPDGLGISLGRVSQSSAAILQASSGSVRLGLAEAIFSRSSPEPAARVNSSSKPARVVGLHGAGEAQRSGWRRPTAPQRASTGGCGWVGMRWSRAKRFVKRLTDLLGLGRRE